MKVSLTIDVEPLPKDRLLAFYTEIAKASIGEREFEITRSLTGLQFGLLQKGGPTHTLNLNAVLQAALEAIVCNGEPIDEPPPGSVIMLHGDTGTAYQRFFRDGLWHADGMDALSWDQITTDAASNRVRVVHTAPDES